MLRGRLIIGLMCLLLLLLAIGLFSIDKCSELGAQITLLIKDQGSVNRNIEQMKASCTKMMAALLSNSPENDVENQDNFSQASGRFGTSLQELGKQEVSEKEKKLIVRLQTAYPQFLNLAQKFLKTKSPEDLTAESRQLSTELLQVLDALDQLSQIQIETLKQENVKTIGEVNFSIRLLFLAMIIAIIVTLYTSLSFSREVIDPLRLLNQYVKEIGKGNLNQTIPIKSNDEVGALLASFNQMTVKLKEYRESTSDELLRIHRTLQATLASFPDPIFVLNNSGAVNFRNPEADRLAVKLLFSGIRRLPEKVDQKVEEVRARGEDYLPTQVKDAIRLHMDDKDHYYLPRIVILRNENGESFGLAVILEEVTRMHLLDEVKSNLVSTVSHELKTPLTSVRMALYLLLEKIVGPLNPKQTELVSTAREDADRLLKTLNDLMDLAKLEHGPAPLEITLISASELVETATRNVKEIASIAEINIIPKVNSNLPLIGVDQQRIGFVFNNLLTNAIKYSSKGGVIEIRVDLDDEDKNKIRFSVRDHGPGIQAEHCSRIFDRFYRVPGTKKTGAGLGLFIAREVIHAHGGIIGVKSVMGKGSEFYFILPVEK